MAAASTIKEGIQKEFLECPICLDSFKKPRCLPCLHAVCSDCLEGWMRGKRRFPCPVCKANNEVPDNGVLGFLVAFHINALQDFVQTCGPKRPTIPCYNDKNQANHADSSVKCLDCNVYYCDECNHGHKMAAVAKNHETIPLSNLTQQHFEKASKRQVTFCQQHPECPLIYYCKEKTCQIPVCQRCNMTKHKLHESIDLEEISRKYREENEKMLQKDLLKAEHSIMKSKDKLREEIKKLEKQFDENKKITHDRYLKMIEDLKQQEQKIVDDAKKSKNEKVKDCEQKITEIDKKLSCLEATRAVIGNMIHFSPDDIIVKQHKELQDQIEKNFEITAPPDLWIHRTEVTSTGEPMVDMKLVSKTKSYKTIKCFDVPVDGIVFLDEFLVTWHWHAEHTPTDFFVSGRNARKAKILKRNLEKMCPQAYRMVPMKRDGHEVLVITESLDLALHHIKIMNINDYKCETIQLKKSMYPYAVAVDRNNDVIFTDIKSNKEAIRKWTKSGVQTIFENTDDNNVLGNPWYVTVNINDDVIISDVEEKSLIIFDVTGTVRKTYNNFTAGIENNPNSVCTDNEGNIYVCDLHGNCIHQLDKDGGFLKYVLTKKDSLVRPTSIEYSNGMFIVGQASGHVKYFKI